jgi:hypothetical protein
VDFVKGQRKDDVMAERLAGFSGSEGVVFIGRAQEKTNLFRTEKRRNGDGRSTTRKDEHSGPRPPSTTPGTSASGKV